MQREAQGYLQQTKKLSDGSYGKIFTRTSSPANGRIMLFACILCCVPKIPNEAALLAHIYSEQHKHHINFKYKPDAASYRSRMKAYRGSKLLLIFNCILVIFNDILVVPLDAPTITENDLQLYFARAKFKHDLLRAKIRKFLVSFSSILS